MSNFISFSDPNAVLIDDQGNPLIGRVQFLDYLTSEPKNVYLDIARTTLAENPQYTDITGTLENQIFLGTGDYKAKFERYIGDGNMKATENANDTQLWINYKTLDLAGMDPAISTSANEVTVLNTIAELRAVVDPTLYPIVEVLGYYSQDDHIAPRTYVWEALSEMTDNYGTVIQVTGINTGRYRMLEPQELDTRYFGIFPSLTETYNSELAALLNWVSSSEAKTKTIRFSTGTYSFVAGTFSFTKKIILEQDVNFRIEGAGTLTIYIVSDYEILTENPLWYVNGDSSVSIQFYGPSSIGNDKTVKSVWFGHTNANDDFEVQFGMMSKIGNDFILEIAQDLNISTVQNDFLAGLRFVNGARLICTGDPDAGSQYIAPRRIERVNFMSRDNIGYENYPVFALTYPKVLNIKWLSSGINKMYSSWFDNNSSVTDFTKITDNTIGITAGDNPTLVIDSAVEYKTSGSDNKWNLVYQNGSIKVTSSGVSINSINAEYFPIFHADTTNAPKIGGVVKGKWFSNLSSNSQVVAPIGAASLANGVVDFLGCGTLTDYTANTIIDGEVEIHNLKVTGTGDFRPQKKIKFIDCEMTTTGASGNGGMISVTGGGADAESMDIIRCKITSNNYGVSHAPLKTRVMDSTISSNGPAVWTSSFCTINNTILSGGILVESSTNLKLTNSDIYGTSNIKSGNCKITNNNFNSNLYLINTSNFLSYFDATNNTFITSSVSPVGVILYNSVADCSVLGVNIMNNTFTGCSNLSTSVPMITNSLTGVGSWADGDSHKMRIGNNISDDPKGKLPKTFGKAVTEAYLVDDSAELWYLGIKGTTNEDDFFILEDSVVPSNDNVRFSAVGRSGDATDVLYIIFNSSATFGMTNAIGAWGYTYSFMCYSELTGAVAGATQNVCVDFEYYV